MRGRTPGKVINVVRTYVLTVGSSIVGNYVNGSCGHCTPCLLATFFFVLVGGLVKLVPFFPNNTGVANGVTIAFILTVYAFLTIGL